MRINRLAVVFAAFVVVALVAPLSAPGVTKPSRKNPYDFVDLKTVPKPKVTGAEIIAGLEEPDAGEIEADVILHVRYTIRQGKLLGTTTPVQA